jgi:hypothetical protein
MVELEIVESISPETARQKPDPIIISGEERLSK